MVAKYYRQRNLVGGKPGGMKKTQKLKIAELTSRLVGKEYNLGQHDCLSVVIYFCDAWGIPFPDEFEGYTKENYAELYEKKPKETKQVFFRLVASLGREVPPERAMPGDFLILEVPEIGEESRAVYIHAGQGNVLAAFTEKGIAINSLKAYKILKAYRWRET